LSALYISIADDEVNIQQVCTMTRYGLNFCVAYIFHIHTKTCWFRIHLFKVDTRKTFV